MDDSTNIVPASPPQASPDNAVIRPSLLKLVNSEFAAMGNGLVVRTMCKLCNSQFREEAEKIFEANHKSIPQIKAFLDGKGLTIAMTNIRHHMNEHYKSMERMAILVEYCEDLQSMMQHRQDRLEDLGLLVNVGKKEMARAVSTPTAGDPIKERDRLLMVEKAFRMMMDALKALTEMENGEAKARAIQVHFVEVWKAKIAAAKDPTEREMLMSTLEDFKKKFVEASHGEEAK